jgi:hypothetical protein
VVRQDRHSFTCSAGMSGVFRRASPQVVLAVEGESRGISAGPQAQ